MTMVSEVHSAARVAIVAASDGIRSLIEGVLAGSDAKVRTRVQLVRDVTRLRSRAGRQLVVFADATRVCDFAMPSMIRSQAKFVLFDSGRSSESLAQALLHLDIRSRERFLAAPAGQNSPPRDLELVARLIAGFASTEDDEPRVATAYVDDGLLVLRSTEFDIMTIPLEMICRDLGGQPEDWEHPEVERLGRYVSWPGRDVDMRWSHLKSVINPTSAVASRQRSDAFNQRYGGAIRSLRRSCGIRQTEVAGLSERNLRRIELGEIRATSTSLEALAQAHGLDLRAYLAELSRGLERIASNDADSG